MMYLFYSVLCLSLTVLLFTVTLIGARNPVRPIWARESIVANVLAPLILAFLILGVGCFTEELLIGVRPGFMECVYAALIVAGTVALVMMLNVRQKLAAFSSEVKSGEIITVDFKTNSQSELPTDTPPNFRKAA